MRMNDKLRIALLIGATVVVSLWPVRYLLAQSQDFINGTTAQQITALGTRIDKIEAMINAVLLAMVINFITQIVQIRRSAERRYR
jgi:hypothetical protein